MSGENRRIKLVAYSFIITIIVSTGFLILNLYDYIGLLNSLKRFDISVAEMEISPEEDEILITLTFTVVNPTTYSRLRLSSLQCQLYLDVDGKEDYIGTIAYSPPSNEPLRPHEPFSYMMTLSIPKARNQFLSTYGPTSELQWRIRCVVHFVTPIRKYYQTMNLYAKSSGHL